MSLTGKLFSSEDRRNVYISSCQIYWGNLADKTYLEEEINQTKGTAERG